MKRYEVENYKTERGEVPFQNWIQDLADAKAQTALIARIVRASYGNFGDWKALTEAKGLYEMRIHLGQGYRIYYTIIEQKIILLLAGSTKRSQDKMIAKATEYLADFNRRTKP